MQFICKQRVTFKYKEIILQLACRYKCMERVQCSIAQFKCKTIELTHRSPRMLSYFYYFH